MKRAKFLLALLVSLSIMGGAYASTIQKKIIVIIWYFNAAANRCNLSFLADAASTTNAELGEEALSTPSASFAAVEPTVSQCTIIIYYLPEP